MLRFFPFMFLLNPHVLKKIHQLRDGTAMGHLTSPHEALGWFRGRDLRNTTTASFARDCSARDFFLTATRLPISDLKDEDRKVIQRSGSPVENAILNAALRFFAYLARNRATLTREIAGALRVANRADIEFHVYGRNCTLFRNLYGRTAAERRPEMNSLRYRSMGYVLTAQLWTDGPFVRSCFAMDGETNIAFCYLLRTRHRELLNGMGLSMIEMSGTMAHDADPLAAVDEWETDVHLANVESALPLPATMEEACLPPPRFGKDFAAAFSGRWPCDDELTR